MSHKLEFTLKQHTPIIHFQHDQLGATLRATEVKPKLDRFIIEKLGDGKLRDEKYKDGIKKAKEKGWLIGEGKHPALDYKTSILDRTNQKEKRIVKNIKLITDPIHSSVISKDITLSISCWSESLLEFIKVHLEKFFVLHNFGTRQNKGWGSFTLDKTKLESFKKILSDSKKPCFARSSIQKDFPINQNWENQIKVDHQRLKSGLNHPSFKKILENENGYEKSMLFQFLNNQTTPLSWDKKFIKKEILKSSFYHKLSRKTPHDSSSDIENISEFVFIRALLGLAEHYEFQIDDNGQVDKKKKYKVKIDGGDVERFKSPLTFKVFEGSIFLILEEIPDNIFNAPFSFSLGTRSKGMTGKEKDDNNFIELTPISTPKKDDFKLEEFINAYANQLNYTPL